MNTDQLRRILAYISTSYNAHYEVVASDQLDLITPRKFPLAVISNTDPRGEPGEHWVAFFMRKQRGPIEFFDSFSSDIYMYNIHFRNFIERVSGKLILMPHPLQCLNSEFCGQYCLTFLHYRLANVPINYIYSVIFTNKCIENDEYVDMMVKKWRRKIRNVHF